MKKLAGLIIKSKRKRNPLDERKLVNLLLAALKKTGVFYSFVDRDSGQMRHTQSGFDFFLAFGGRVVLYEAKIEKGKLSDFQKYTEKMAGFSGTPYKVLRFFDVKKTTDFCCVVTPGDYAFHIQDADFDRLFNA